MALKRGVSGTLYVNQDKDLKIGSIGPYAKIGIVRRGKPVGDRVKQLQTGNPRRIFTIKSYKSQNVEYLENRLHNKFNTKRVSGEWFEMDSHFIMNDLDNLIKEYLQQEEEHVKDLIGYEAQSQVVSNGKSRKPSKYEKKLHKKYIEQNNIVNELNARIEFVKYDLVSLMNNYQKINDIIALEDKFSQEKVFPKLSRFNEKDFSLQYPDIYNEFLMSESKVKSVVKLLNVPKFAETNDVLHGFYNLTKKKIEESKNRLLENQFMEPNNESKKFHLDYLILHSEWFTAKDMRNKTKLRLLNLLGEYEEIEGVISWKRKIKEDYRFRFDECNLKYPDILSKFLNKEEIIVPKKEKNKVYVISNKRGYITEK